MFVCLALKALLDRHIAPILMCRSSGRISSLKVKGQGHQVKNIFSRGDKLIDGS